MRSIHLSCFMLLALGCSSSETTGTGGASAGDEGSVTTGAGGAAGGTTTGSAGAGGGGCVPGSKSCDGTSAVKTCKADGSGYDSMPCPPTTTCENAICGQCSPVGSSSCQGSMIMTCGADGQLHEDKTCPPGTTCLDGLCDDIRCPDELKSAGTTALPALGWPRYRHDNRSSGWSHAVVPDMPVLKWKVFVGGTGYLNSNGSGLAAGPVVNQNDIIFISGGDADGKGGHFYAFDASAMSVYEFPGVTGYGYTTPAVRVDGTAYYSTADGHAYAVNPNGTQQWLYTFGFQNDCSPIVTHDGYVIYGSDTDELFALHSDGTLLWQSNPASGAGEVDSALAESCDGVIYAGGENGWTALDAMTGTTLWQVPVSGAFQALMSSPNVTADGTMYGIDSAGIGYAVDKNGTVLWSKQVGPAGPATDFARVGDKVFAMLNDGSLHGFDATNGNELWSMPVNNAPEIYRHAAPVIDGHMRLYINSNDGNVYAFDTAGTQLWKLAASGIPTPGNNSYGTMAIGKDGTLYVPGNDGYLYAFH